MESGRKRQRTRSSSTSGSGETARDELERTMRLTNKTSHANLPRPSNPSKTPLPASSPPRPLRPAQTRAHASAKSPRFGHRRRLAVYSDHITQPDEPMPIPPTPLADTFAQAALQSPLPRTESHAQRLLYDLDTNLHNIPPILGRSFDQSMSSIIIEREDVAMQEPIIMPKNSFFNRILPMSFNFEPVPAVEMHTRTHSNLPDPETTSSPPTNEHADRPSPSPDRPIIPPTFAPRFTTLRPRIKPRLHRRKRHESSSSNVKDGLSDDELASQFGPLALQDDEDRFREKVKRRVGEGGRKSEGLKGKHTLRMKILSEGRINADETSSDPLAQFVVDDTL